MRLLLAIFLFCVLGCISLSAQVSVNWSDFKAQDNHIQLTLKDEVLNLELKPNLALSKSHRLVNSEIKSFDLVDTQSKVVGKFTIFQDYKFISLRKNGSFHNLKWENNELQSSEPTRQKICGTKESPAFFGEKFLPTKSASAQPVSPSDLNYGDELTTFRLALIGTGEYTQQNGGTATAALATAVSTVNALNLIFETDLSITLSLVASEFYTNSSTDPFSPSGDNRTNQAAEAMGMNFNDADYDLGHVFHYRAFGSPWPGGGIAGLGVVCDNNTFFTQGDSDGLNGPNKAAAWSGSFENTNNDWVQLVAHEFGHQFAASHSFNGDGNSNCDLGISSVSAYEIGSGTTIMAYNGLCSQEQNVPGNGIEDNYFHSTSLDQMAGFISALQCGNSISNSNSIPQISISNSSGLTIPIGTPFELEGTAADADGDVISYTWEQIDEDGPGTSTQGFIGAEAANSTSAPLFKSVPPSESPIRVFPELSEILDGNNQNIDFEALPLNNRTLNFSLTARDGNGGVSSGGLALQSSTTAGPFSVTSQNSDMTWTADGISTATVTWNVANTDNSTIDCQTVDIFLSTDNGQNFNHVIAQNTANDGEHTFTIPNLSTSIGRIKIKASNNVFFDINDGFISIDSSCEANGVSFSPNINVSADAGSSELALNLSPEYGSVISTFSGTLENSDDGTTLAATVSGNCLNFGGNATIFDEFEFQVTASGTYSFNQISGGFGSVVHVYEDEFISSSPCNNWIGSSYDTGPGFVNPLSVNLSAGINYVLVISGFNSSFPSLPDVYSYGYSGAGNCVTASPAPVGFDYEYLIIDDSNTLLEVIATPDLTSYSGGIYTVQGISVLAGTDLSAYIGQPLSSLQADIAQFMVCANLSSNQIQIDITGSECLGDFNSDGLITASDLSTFLSDFGCLTNCFADLNGDNVVTSSDLTMMLSLFGTSCP